MDLRVDLRLNGERRIVGIMKGYDQFMNIVLDEAIEIRAHRPGPQVKDEEQKEGIAQTAPTTGTVAENDVQKRKLGTIVIRGSSIVLWENIDKVQ